MDGMYIEEAQLASFGASTARLLQADGETDGRAAALALRQNMARIDRCYEAVRRRYAQQSAVPAACEWLLDNRYLARRETLGALGDLRRARHLRACTGEALILSLARALVEAGGGRVTEERCRLFLDGFQSVTVLHRAELTLFPQALRAAVIGQVAAVCRELCAAADTAALTAPLEALFGTLRLFSTLDLDPLLQDADRVQALLAADPGGVFPRMDRESRQDYLRRIEILARREGTEEMAFASRLLERAAAEGRHVGFLLFREPSPLRARLYIAANVLLTLFLSLLPAFALRSAWAAPLLLLPVSELVKSALDYLLLRLVKPCRLPRLDMEKGVPAEGRTLCVISALLGSVGEAEALAARLERLSLACRSEGKALSFGLLADLPAAETAETEADEPLLRAARAAVAALNRRYGGGFYLFTRPRRFDGERWTGWERKRGALLALARLLCGEENELRVDGDADALAGIPYILTLDSDTELYPGAAGELIGAMLHPLNRPVLDKKRGVVTHGHAIIHPRIDTTLESACATDFALIFAGGRGSDPYGGLCGELYMDAFDNGGFAGKGILDTRCLLACTERLPEKRVLSHDALEGAFLRGAFCGDAAFADAFPARPLAYYRRLHRWIRGDWQNLPWVFCRALCDLDRWRLFDSLRRSLVAPLTLLALLCGFFRPAALAVAAWAALAALLSELFFSLADGSLRRRPVPSLRRFTRLLTGVGGAIVRAFLRLWLLPCEAWVSLSAIALSLWRMLVSHRDLLQWQTAAQSARRSDALAGHVKALWPSVALGPALLLFAPVIIGKAAGLSWLFAPAAAFALALPAYREPELGARDRDYLRAAAGEAIGYYLDSMGEEDHFLPPDNFQEQPPVGLAHRTSPTNIGLALLSLAAAVDLELLKRDEALVRIARSLDTLERLPRFRGHFYNWYDTRSLSPLTPPFLSTVDSGNLCAALMTLGEALREWGAAEAAGRVDALAEAMDFSFLYDGGRGLFYICYDTVQQRGRGGWYDLMASEAMLTSYLALARGDVPKKHWRRLGRGQLQKDGYRGLASWAGTMFEYRMPALFLPYRRGSLLYESSRFCLYAQKRRVPPGRPWGVSESAFYSLDAALNYRYKANGCAALALKRGQDRDLVVSPYSSFLALGIDPLGAVGNLRRLERLGACGRYGFIEALDFTPGRCRGREGEPVRCYMAHHIGMSVLAADNALCGGAMQKRFFSRPAMAAFRLLLEERLPDGQVLRRDRSEPPEDGPGRNDPRWRLRGSGDGPEHLCRLSNGAYHLLLDQNGHSRADVRETRLYGALPLRESAGLYLELWEGDQKQLLFPGPHPKLWELSEDQALWQGMNETLAWEYRAETAAGELGERRCLRLRALEGADCRVRLSFRPLLARPADLAAHPAFWKLGIECEEAEGALLLHRLARSAQPELWLCLACDAPAVCRSDLRLPLAGLELCLTLDFAETRTLRFALCAGPDREAALRGAQRILRGSERGNMVSAAAARLGMNAAEAGAAMALLASLERSPALAAPRRELWPYGVSGDWPLLCCEAGAAEALPLLRRWLLLKSCGAEAELVYLSEEQGEYRRPYAARIAGYLAAQGLDALIGSRGGVHFLPPAAAEAVGSRAVYTAGRERSGGVPLRLPVLSRPRHPGAIPEHRWTDEAFTFTVRGDLPGRAWQLPLSNGRFGAIAADVGLAALWQENAREQRLTAPMEELRSVQPPAALWIEHGGEPLSLFAANDGRSCLVRFGRGWASWEKRLDEHSVTTTAFVPLGTDALVLLIRGAGGLPLRFGLQPLLGPDTSSLRAEEREGLCVFQNAESYLPDLRLLVGCSVRCAATTDWRPPALLLNVPASRETVLAIGCCGEEALRALLEPAAARRALKELQAYWTSLVSRQPLASGVAALDRYANGWAVYQALACRLRARASLYQSGGAYGFRDQLQDAVNLLPIAPVLARERIEDACRHQYEEGDVMHWWHPHPAGDKGVRTRCSDDLLWLVWALGEYCETCGRTDFLLSPLPWRSSPPLCADERDRYETPAVTGHAAPVLEHARAALDCCLRRGLGPHGLPWFGSGDWNDGLDAVEGESVWLGWFLSLCCDSFASLLERLKQPGAGRYREQARQIGRAANAAWGGSWFYRGYTADGAPLGGPNRIDALPQAWAALSPYAESARVDAALDACLARLVDEEHRLVKLFAPPFTAEEPSPGYLTSYGAGFRENGGQYTHAAIWLARAFLRRGRRGTALHLLTLLLPEGRDLSRYEAEPFVLPADICAAPGREGEAGWTWYTGSAGWFWRVLREAQQAPEEPEADEA